MGCFPKPVHANVTASVQVYRALSHREVRVFVAASRQLCSGLNKVCGEAETFSFLDESLMKVEKLKTSCMNTLYGLNRSSYAQNGG